jgi:single-stranded DNA-specific DHH superfamily exonuclease
MSTSQPTFAKKMNRLLPFVAIGTVADCQSILEPTNRLLVKAGLNTINQGQIPYPGLNELTKQTALGDKQMQGYQIGSRDLAFTYSPILNSSGRMSHAKLSIDTLAANPGNSSLLAQELIATNHQRKQDVKNITKDLETDARSQVESGKKMIWIQGDFSKGLTGLLASKLENQFQLPVTVVSKSGEIFTGSMRAGVGYHLPKVLRKVEKYLTKYGGHPHAAGFSTTESQIEFLRESLQEEFETYQPNISSELNYIPKEFRDIIPRQIRYLKTRKELVWLESQDELSADLLKETMSLDPFGQDFSMPEYIVPLERYETRLFGSEGQHLKININGITLTSFYLDTDKQQMFFNEVQPSKLWVKVYVSQNSWNNRTNLELIGDILFAE